MKPFVALALFASLALAASPARAEAPRAEAAADAQLDVAKAAGVPPKLGHEARMYVVDKDAPTADKTVRLARAPRTALKDK